jgi:hypothetical protein
VGAGLRGIVFQRQVGGKNGKPIIAGGGGAWSYGSGAEKQQHNGNDATESLGSIHGEARSLVERRTGGRAAVLRRAAGLGSSSQAVT